MTPPPDDTADSPSELITRFQSELKADPRSLVFIPLANALSDAGRYQEAVDVCRRGLAAHPDTAAARLVLAQACLKLKKPAEAIVELTKVLKQDPNGREPLLLLGAALLERGDAGRAQQALQRAASIFPDDAEVGTLLALANERLGSGRPPGASAPKSAPAPAKPAVAPAKPAAAPARPVAPPAAGGAPPAKPAGSSLPLPTKPPAAAFATPWKPPVAASAVAPPTPLAAEEDEALEAVREMDAPSITSPERRLPRELLAAAQAAESAPAPAAPPPAAAAPAPAPRAPAPAPAPRAPAPAPAPRAPAPAPAPAVPTPGALDEGETGRGPAAPGPPSRLVDGTLASTVLRPDAPLQAAARVQDEGEVAWHRTRRLSMLLVWGTALGVVLLATGVTLVAGMLRRSEVERRFASAAAGVALATPQGYRAAAADYREILRREPDNTRAASHLALAAALLATTYGEGADSTTQAQVQRAWFGETMKLRRKPGAHSAEVLAARALAALLQGERTEAERLVKQASTAHPRSTHVLYAAGLTRWAVGDAEGAASALKAAFADAPDQVAPRLALAAMMLEGGAAVEAAAAYGDLLKRHPDHGGALLGRALAAIDQGRGAEALDEVRVKLAPAALPAEGAAATTGPGGEKLAPVGLEAWRQLALAQCELQRGAAAEAQAALESAASGAPPDPRFHLRLVRARLAQGRITEARAAFVAVTKLLGVAHPAVALSLAELSLAQGYDAEAEKLLEALPRSPERDFALGRARLVGGKPGPALEAFTGAQATRAADPRLKVYLLLAKQLATGGTPAAAVVAELKGLTTGGGAGLAHWALGRIFLAAGDPAQARAWLAAAQGDHFESARAAVALAAILRERREPGAAQEVLEKALERGGEHVPARAALGRLYEGLFRNLEARVALSRALGLEGTPARGPRGYRPDPDDYVAAALANARLGFLADAEGALQRANDAKAAGPRLLRAQALLEALRGEAATALKSLGKVKDPSAAMRVDLGAVARAAGDAKAAEAAYTAALREDPEHVEALLGLGQLYLLMRDRSTQAIATFTRALAAYEKRPYLGKAKRANIHVGLGRAFLLAGPQRNPEKARAALEAAVADAPADPEAHLHLGRYRLGEGDLQKAAAAAARALALDPGSADASFVLAESVAKTDPRRARAAYSEYLRLARDGPHAAAARQALERLK